MHQRASHIGAGMGHGRRGDGVDLMGKRLFLFGAVHGGIGRGVDDGAWRMGADRLFACGGIAQIGLVPAQEHGIRRALCQLGGDLSGLAENKQAHAVPTRVPTPSISSRGSHHSGLSRYHCTVFSRPCSTVTEGFQPSSSVMRSGSMA